jgi:hypothetical protein
MLYFSEWHLHGVSLADHVLQVACAFALASAAPPNGRILFKHGLSGTHLAPEFHDRLRRGLAEQHSRNGRGLLQNKNLSDIHFVSLGKHVGVDMVEIPEGVSYEWILEELKNHPGEKKCGVSGASRLLTKRFS